MLQGMLQLARNQIIIRGQLENHENRLEAIEAQLAAPEHAVTQSQAMQISQAVKAVATAQGNQSGRNEFGSVYGELYRKFEVTSYKLLPAAKFEEVMSRLTAWHQELTGDTPF
ncbi:MAG: ORF6C domain-containing protein [Chloroflexi bacterium]|nr:ORF6C domain-containing protein [Chloroflexota bacterium]